MPRQAHRDIRPAVGELVADRLCGSVLRVPDDRFLSACLERRCNVPVLLGKVGHPVDLSVRKCPMDKLDVLAVAGDYAEIRLQANGCQYFRRIHACAYILAP